ncbi:hypothetical protein SeMB42_g04372 [Synchytrium endobioticum]|uniref:Bacterial surface antigen (D15) domain-containing protein n=1 Tax=Synchytrium endobioticum TaxID=286115 RepID=A0A507CYV9_9FUNG|nr:hypothetical protein SeMB42_g04372 [Synchytrium endobioticum]
MKTVVVDSSRPSTFDGLDETGETRAERDMAAAFDEQFQSSFQPAEAKNPSSTAPCTDAERAKRALQERQLIDLVNNAHNRPAHVAAIRIQGAQRTRPWVIEKHILPILDKDSVQTIGDVLFSSQRACQQLTKLGIFESVQVILDTPHDTYTVTEGIQGKEVVDVIIDVKETNLVTAKSYVDMETHDARMGWSARLKNIFGTGQFLEGNLQNNVVTLDEDKVAAAPILTQPMTSFKVEYSAPWYADPDKRVNAGVFNLNKNMNMFSSYSEHVTGAFLRYQFFSKWGHHHASADGAIRHLHSIADRASLSVRNDAGHSLKTSLSHALVQDTRDDFTIPTRGHYLRIYKELAGLLGDVRHLKGELEGQFSLPLTSVMHITATARGGLIYPLNVSASGNTGPTTFTRSDGNNSRPRNRVNDRFLLGGMTSVRGFRFNSIGPRDGSDNIGGDIYWTAGLSLISKLPYPLNYDPFRGHAFINAGSARLLNHLTDIPSNVKSVFMDAPSISTGMGLIVKFSMVRLEINYCLPLTMTTSDSFKKGWHWGVGLSFL